LKENAADNTIEDEPLSLASNLASHRALRNPINGGSKLSGLRSKIFKLDPYLDR